MCLWFKFNLILISLNKTGPSEHNSYSYRNFCYLGTDLVIVGTLIIHVDKQIKNYLHLLINVYNLIKNVIHIIIMYENLL